MKYLSLKQYNKKSADIKALRKKIEMLKARLEKKEEDLHTREKPHILCCDEYHAHQAPNCCSPDCWCRGKEENE